jgi:nucleoside 2-deoxyribosyltransferase
MKFVYLAGSITGATYGEANDWRFDFGVRLQRIGVTGVSPLRCEPIRGATYSPTNADPKFGTARAIASKNKLDVQTCDLTLCYMPQSVNAARLSLGTIIELAWATAFGKPTILVTDYPLLQAHPVVQANASWLLTDLDEAFEVIEGIFGVYSNAIH